MNKREFTFFENSKILKNTVFEYYSILRIEHVVIKIEKFSEMSLYFRKSGISIWDFQKSGYFRKVDISKKVNISKNGCKKVDSSKGGYFKKWIFSKSGFRIDFPENVALLPSKNDDKR